MATPASTAESFRDRIGTVNEDGKRIFINPKKPKGPFYNARTYVSIVLLALLFSGPFITINGHPLMLFNVLERKFIIFGMAFWPQDFSLLMLGGITFIVFILLFTVIYGRLFCGWICPQTIFMEMVFRKIEYWIDGDHSAQRKLRKAPWTAQKLGKRTLKFVIFFGLSFIIANTFLAYLIGVKELKLIITDNPANHIGGLISIFIFTSIFFFVFWWFREQACLIVCPYGRLQGVMLDKNSINVSYDFVRGEKRGKNARNRDESLGDCIDCNECVVVCPTGIDIRNGTQMECVNCTACMDACDNVMVKINKPKGLIRYSSYNRIVGAVKNKFNTRIVAYSVVLFVLASFFTTLMVIRPDTETNILRARGLDYQTTEDGKIKNLYTFKSLNKTFYPKEISFNLVGIEGSIEMVGTDMTLEPQSLAQGGLFVVIPNDALKTSTTKIEIEVVSEGKVLETLKVGFTGPNK